MRKSYIGNANPIRKYKGFIIKKSVCPFAGYVTYTVEMPADLEQYNRYCKLPNRWSNTLKELKEWIDIM